MKIPYALSLFTHLTALCGFISMWITGQVGVVPTVFFAGALLLSFSNERCSIKYYVGGAFSTVLALALISYLTISVFFLGRELFGAILDFLIYIQIIKLLSSKELRDIIQIYVLSFFQFLAGAVLTVDFTYGIVFIIYVVIAVCAVMVFSMHKESLEAGRSVEKDASIVTAKFLSTTILISLCVFVFAALIFVTMPRIRSGFFISGFLKTNKLKSGFSDEVELGRVGQIMMDDSPVMRVRILNTGVDKFPNPIYWKGVTLNEFDGSSWKASGSDYELYKSGRNGVLLIEESVRKSLHQEIVTEPLDTDVLFSANRPVGFKNIPGNRVTRVGGAFIVPNKQYSRLKYYAYSDISVPSQEELVSDVSEYPAQIERTYMQLPSNMSEKLRELARDITRLEDNPYDKAIAVKRYLIMNLSYTRTLEESKSGFPLEDFLFEQKAGHCEYFATAMAILLRSSGVPTRIVNGFLGGDWNEHGEFFLVRQSNAHSWVEVYFPAYGWVTFDPTPAGDGSAEFSALSYLGAYVDYLKFRWDRYIIDFNQRDQIRIFNSVRDKMAWNRGEMRSLSKYRAGFDKRLILIAVFAGLVAWVFVRKPDMRNLLSGRKAKREHKASVLYKKALAMLAKRGYPKPDNMTPDEYSEYLLKTGGEGFKTIRPFTARYLAVRFGNLSDDKNLETLSKIFLELKAEIR